MFCSYILWYWLGKYNCKIYWNLYMFCYFCKDENCIYLFLFYIFYWFIFFCRDSWSYWWYLNSFFLCMVFGGICLCFYCILDLFILLNRYIGIYFGDFYIGYYEYIWWWCCICWCWWNSVGLFSLIYRNICVWLGCFCF